MPSSGGTVVNAQRTAQMQEDAIQKRMDGRGGAGGGTNLLAPTMVNAPTSSQVNLSTISIVDTKINNLVAAIP